MRTINKREREELKEYTDKNFGGYEIAEFTVNVFSSEYGKLEEKKEKMQFRGEIFKNNSGDDLFTVYNQFHDGFPEWIVFSKNELADQNVNVLKKTSIQQEKDEELAREIARRENQQRMQEERIAESKRRFEEQAKINEKAQEAKRLTKEAKLKEDKMNFLNDKGFLLEITELDEENLSLTARMTDKYNKTLATFNYTSLISYEEFEPSEGFLIEDDDFAYPYMADEDSLTIYDNKGKIIDDEGAIFVAKEAIESLKIWSKEDLEIAKNCYVDLDKPERNISFDDKDSEKVFRTLETIADNEQVQRVAKARTRIEAENQRSRNKP